MTSSPNDFKRRLQVRWNYLIYPRFQLSLVAILTLILGATQSTLWFQVERVLRIMNQRGEAVGLPPDHVYFQFLAEQRDLVHAHMIWGTVIAFVLSTLAAITLSHRLAGPIVRLRKHLQEIAMQPQKQFEPIQFRERDFFSDLPKAFNQAVHALRTGAPQRQQDPANSGSKIDRGAA